MEIAAFIRGGSSQRGREGKLGRHILVVGSNLNTVKQKAHEHWQGFVPKPRWQLFVFSLWVVMMAECEGESCPLTIFWSRFWLINPTTEQIPTDCWQFTSWRKYEHVMKSFELKIRRFSGDVMWTLRSWLLPLMIHSIDNKRLQNQQNCGLNISNLLARFTSTRTWPVNFFFKSQRRHFGAKAFLGLSDGWLAAACSLFGLALWCLTDCGVVQHAACQAQSESYPRNPRIPVDQPVQKNWWTLGFWLTRMGSRAGGQKGSWLRHGRSDKATMTATVWMLIVDWIVGIWRDEGCQNLGPFRWAVRQMERAEGQLDGQRNVVWLTAGASGSNGKQVGLAELDTGGFWNRSC
jgi:hypothetical protein